MQAVPRRKSRVIRLPLSANSAGGAFSFALGRLLATSANQRQNAEPDYRHACRLRDRCEADIVEACIVRRRTVRLVDLDSVQSSDIAQRERSVPEGHSVEEGGERCRIPG